MKTLTNAYAVLYSNYDCINSHWLESQAPYSYKESYFGAMLDALNLNPAKVKKLLLSKYLMVCGSWPNKKDRDGNEYVSYEDFWREEQNRGCGACHLVVTFKIDPEATNMEFIVVPAGNYCGAYSTGQGGGSLMEMELQRDLKINLSKHGKTKYDRWEILHDGERGYSIASVYGVDSSFFGAPAN